MENETEMIYRVVRKVNETRASEANINDFIPLVVFAGVLLIIMIILTGYKISQILEKPVDLDPPPRYDGLDIVVPAPIGPDFIYEPQTEPPTYETAVSGDSPPSYTFVNEAFEEPPAYTAIDIDFTVATTRTTVFHSL